MLRRFFAIAFLALFANAQMACDDKSKSKSEKDDDDDKGKKKKKKSKDDDDDDDGEKKAKKGVEVPGTNGFVVPPGGTYKHNSLAIGDKTLELDSYDYPIADFPRAELRKSLGELLKKAGWKVEGDVAKDSTIRARKGGKLVSVIIGEANADSTKLNVPPPLPDDGGGDEPAGDVEDFTGDYTSNYGATTMTQKGNKVTIKYPIGSASCTATGKVLNCAWFETGSSGKAILTKKADGQLVGTWGSGASATNGGPWNFTPKKK